MCCDTPLRRCGLQSRPPAPNRTLPPTLRLHALGQLVDHGAQREQALVDGRALLHALPLGPRLGDALRAGQVNQREGRYADGAKVLTGGRDHSRGSRVLEAALGHGENMSTCRHQRHAIKRKRPRAFPCRPASSGAQAAGTHLCVVGVGVAAARLHHHAEDGVGARGVLVHLGLPKVAVPLAALQPLQHLRGGKA